MCGTSMHEKRNTTQRTHEQVLGLAHGRRHLLRNDSPYVVVDPKETLVHPACDSDEKLRGMPAAPLRASLLELVREHLARPKRRRSASLILRSLASKAGADLCKARRTAIPSGQMKGRRRGRSRRLVTRPVRRRMSSRTIETWSAFCVISLRNRADVINARELKASPQSILCRWRGCDAKVPAGSRSSPE
jgi:hypothetical protein